MINLLAKILTNFIPIKKLRRRARWKFITKYNGKQIYKNAKHVGKNLICGSPCVASKNTYIGDNVRLSGISISGKGNVTISDHVVLGYDVVIMTSNHNYDKGSLLPFSDEVEIVKDVFIDKYVWCGSKVIILPGTKIGEGAVIQAGAVVHGEIPPCAVAGGNPAKVFKYRDMEHYNKLKNENKFLCIED